MSLNTHNKKIKTEKKQHESTLEHQPIHSIHKLKKLLKILPSESVQRFDPCLLLLHSLLQLGSDCSVDERAWISQILQSNYMSVKYKMTKICAHIFQFVGWIVFESEPKVPVRAHHVLQTNPSNLQTSQYHHEYQ